MTETTGAPAGTTVPVTKLGRWDLILQNATCMNANTECRYVFGLDDQKHVNIACMSHFRFHPSVDT